MAYQPELIGGHIALDLLNTVSWRLDPARIIDRISTPEELATWCAAVGLADAPRVEREWVVALREIVYDALLPIARGMQPTDLSGLQRLLVQALGRATPVAVRPLDW